MLRVEHLRACTETVTRYRTGQGDGNNDRSSKQSKLLFRAGFVCLSAHAEGSFRGGLGFFGKRMCPYGFLMGRYLIVLAVMFGGTTMRFASGIMMLCSIDVMIMGHGFSDLLGRAGGCNRSRQ